MKAWMTFILLINFLIIEIISQGFLTRRCGCGFYDPGKGRIIGGERVAIFEMPWYAGILDKEQLLCGGVLINDQYILTAARCFFNTYDAPEGGGVWNKTDKPLTILIGTSSLLSIVYQTEDTTGSDVIRRTMDKAIIHPDYVPADRSYNNIALAKFDRPIEKYAHNILPICLPFTDQNFERETVTAAGWGPITFYPNEKPSVFLHKILMKICPDAECYKALDDYNNKTSFCAAYSGHYPCREDYGGPLIHEYKKNRFTLAGILSSLNQCDTSSIPSTFTNVSSFVLWITINTPTANYCERDVNLEPTQNCTCGLDIAARARIKGGELAVKDEFPWFALMVLDATFFCGGTLINNRYALSAGHCFYSTDENNSFDYRHKNITVILGAKDLDVLRYSYQVSEAYDAYPMKAKAIILHDLYNPSYHDCHDIALVQFDQGLQKYEHNVLPVCLPIDHFPGWEVDGLYIGYGQTDINERQSYYLKKVYNKVFPNYWCVFNMSFAYPYNYGINTICTYFAKETVCKGDGGGPVMTKYNDYQYVQVGVITTSECKDMDRIISSDVYEYKSWIMKHTSDGLYCEHDVAQ